MTKKVEDMAYAAAALQLTRVDQQDLALVGAIIRHYASMESNEVDLPIYKKIAIRGVVLLDKAEDTTSKDVVELVAIYNLFKHIADTTATV